MSDFVLVVNAGSSSLKYSLVDAGSGTAVASGHVERIGEAIGRIVHDGRSGQHHSEREIATHEDALRAAMDAFAEHGPSLDEIDLAAVGHRVVHGGARFSEPVLVDDALVAKVKELIPLAPLHNPANLEGIATALKLFPEVPQVAVFDTAFHSTLPPEAYTYAVPHSWVEEHRIRRYGFHGTSYSFVSGEAARLLGRPLDELNLIVLHLGNGASAAAVRRGDSVDTSMGLTPLEGLVMGTRTASSAGPWRTSTGSSTATPG
jgi:acetate kinase